MIMIMMILMMIIYNQEDSKPYWAVDSVYDDHYLVSQKFTMIL